jgi:hypothetical protein
MSVNVTVPKVDFDLEAPKDTGSEIGAGGGLDEPSVSESFDSTGLGFD